MSTTTDAAAARRLRAIKLLHTFVWVVFAGAIVAIPVTIVADRLRFALWLSLLVWGEVAVLALNRLRCPLTGVAARYTKDRADNFDIFLPLWLARWNKVVFGSLFALTQLWLAWLWLG
jgi:hypothetical protein